jgi:HEAT repeat protein
VVGSLRDGTDRPRLSQALADADAGVRLAALKALGKQAALRDLDQLLALLPDPDWAVRQEAADAIAAQPGFDRAAVERIADTVADRYGRDALRRAIAERHP